MTQLTKMFKDVRDFRKAFGLDLLSEQLTDKDIDLHDSLIIEELVELADAKNDIERLDAIVDSAYVLMGRFVHSTGSFEDLHFVEILIKVAEAKGYNFSLAWDIVHASNMSKLCVSLDEARLTQADYDQKGYSVEIIAMENYYIVRNAEDVTLSCGKFVKKGKTLKSINYMQADLTPALPNKCKLTLDSMVARKINTTTMTSLNATYITKTDSVKNMMEDGFSFALIHQNVKDGTWKVITEQSK